MQFKKINIVISDPESPDAVKLQDQLSNDLYHRFGSDGRNSFQGWLKADERHVFLIAYLGDEPVGCGAIRPFSDEIAELKRMFSLYQGKGIGMAILEALEAEAKAVGYKKIWLETRVANQGARNFYVKNNYQEIENYGKYQGVKNAICYEKILMDIVQLSSYGLLTVSKTVVCILFFFFFAVKGAFSQAGTNQTVQQKYDALFAGFGSNPTEKQIGRAYNEVLHFQNASLDKAIMLRQRLRYADDRTYQLFKTKDSLLVQLGRAYERPPQLRGDTRALEQNITEIENLILTRVQRSNRYYLALSEQFAHELYKNNPSPSCYICYLKIHFKKGHRKLADQLYVYSARKERTPLRWQQVRNELTDGEVSVEFVSFRDTVTGDLQYAALLLRKGFESPQYVQLCTQSQLNEVLLKGTADDELYLQNLYSPIAGVEQPTLYELIWKPLLPFLKNTRKIYYAPAGDLHRINLAAISPGEGVPPLQDKYRFVLINSTRSLVNTYSEMAERLASLPDIKMPCFFGATVPNGFPARFFGNIELDYYGPDVDANNREAVLYGSINYDLDSLAIRAPIRENVYAPRSGRGEAKSHRRRNFIKGEDWEYLFGTKTEIESIGALLQGSAYKVRVLEGNNATEESFKKLSASGVSPRVLHIATHGFFFSDTTSQDTEEQMNRSGLILAGANYAWKAGTPLSGREDGILSAFEISHTNLRSTELVVLSACETGLGYIVNNEGVFGLQRAFKQAGVKNLLVSLWSIPDNATQVLMTEFYRNCLERNMPMPEALKAAQKWMRNQQGYENPYFWAGFVLLE